MKESQRKSEVVVGVTQGGEALGSGINHPAGYGPEVGVPQGEGLVNDSSESEEHPSPDRCISCNSMWVLTSDFHHPDCEECWWEHESG